MFARLKPFEPRRQLLQDYFCGGVRFAAGGAWRHVDDELAKHLARVRHAAAEASLPAFEFADNDLSCEPDGASVDVAEPESAVLDSRVTMVDDELWERLEPLIPAQPRGLKGGRPPVNDRVVLEGILFVLGQGIGWQRLPREIGSGVTCWRRLRMWRALGVWDQMNTVLDSLKKRRLRSSIHPKDAKVSWREAT